MSSDKPRLHRVKPGDLIKADLFNQIVDQMQNTWQRDANPNAKHPGIIVSAKNVGETDLSYRDAATITSQNYPFSPEKKLKHSLSVQRMSTNDAADAIAVALQPIAAGDYGLVQISGLTWVNAEGSKSGERGTLAAYKTNLVLGDTGAANVIAVETDDEDTITVALIHWPVGSASSEAQINWQFVWNEGE